jgi:hypothetical protein
LTPIGAASRKLPIPLVLGWSSLDKKNPIGLITECHCGLGDHNTQAAASLSGEDVAMHCLRRPNAVTGLSKRHQLQAPSARPRLPVGLGPGNGREPAPRGEGGGLPSWLVAHGSWQCLMAMAGVLSTCFETSRLSIPLYTSKPAFVYLWGPIEMSMASTSTSTAQVRGAKCAGDVCVCVITTASPEVVMPKSKGLDGCAGHLTDLR